MHKENVERIFLELTSKEWQINESFRGKDIVSVEQMSKDAIEHVLDTADLMEALEPEEARRILRNKSIAVLFYQPSTRTYLSFLQAGMRLGAYTQGVHDMTYSSVSKGETIEDTFKTVEALGFDLICLRHPDDDAALNAAKAIKIPVVNGGAGKLEHPTQALLDLRTIKKESKSKNISDIHIAFIGDLKYGRTVHSLAKVMAMFGGPIQSYVSPFNLKMPQGLKSQIKGMGTYVYETTDLEDIISEADVLYVTRVQKEWFSSTEEYERAKESYMITEEIMKKARKDMVLMHPLPRVGEISVEVDEDPRAAYFREVKNGVFTRMALLSLILENDYVA